MSLKIQMLVAGMFVAATTSGFAQVLTHEYNLDNSYADSLGGPSLVSMGGTVGPNGYTSPGPDEGLQLTGAVDPNNYSIQMVFTIDSLTSGDAWVKLIDFADRTLDAGLYEYGGGDLNLYPGLYTSQIFAAQNLENMVITESGGQFNAYLNGMQVASYADPGYAVFAGTGATDVATFLADDFATGGVESTGGSVEDILIWDGALSADQAITVTSSIPTPSAVPDAANVAGLLGFAMAGLSAFKKPVRRS